MATNPRQAERESSDLGHETRKATDQAAQTAGRTTRAGAEAFRRNAEAPKKHSRAELKRGAALRNDLWTPSPCLRPPRTSPKLARPTDLTGGRTMRVQLKPATVVGRAAPRRELHPIVKRIIEAMVADIIAEEDQAKKATCLSEFDDQE